MVWAAINIPYHMENIPHKHLYSCTKTCVSVMCISRKYPYLPLYPSGNSNKPLHISLNFGKVKCVAEVTGSNPVEALIFFRLLLSNCLNWKINCDDRSSLRSTTAVHIWIISYIPYVISCNGDKVSKVSRTWEQGKTACGRLGKQTSARKGDFRSSKNNFRGHDISRPTPLASLSVPSFSLDSN